MNKCVVLFIIALLPFCIYGQVEIKKLSLSEAIEIGLKNNPEVKSAMENISVAKGKFWSGISLPQPEIGVSYEYIPAKSSLNNYNERTLEFRQSFEFPSNYFLKGSKLNKEEEIAIYKLNISKRSVITQVKTNYFKALAREYQLRFAEDNLSISEDFLKKAEMRLNIGEGTNIEKMTAKVQYTEAKNNFEVSKNELITAFAELNYTLGYSRLDSEPNYIFTDSLSYIEHNINLEKLYNTLKETNPQIKIAELNCGIAAVDESLAWSSIMPSFNIAYFKQTRDGVSDYYGASFGISVPLWFMFDQKGKIQEATANQSKTVSDLQSIKNEIILKLKSSFTDHENNLRQVKLYKYDILPQAEEIFRAAVKSYDAGELTYIEYLQAKQTLINARNSYINALFNHYQSVFKIEEIVGQNIIDQSEMRK